MSEFFNQQYHLGFNYLIDNTDKGIRAVADMGARGQPGNNR